jgi:hypothetical protein
MHEPVSSSALSAAMRAAIPVAVDGTLLGMPLADYRRVRRPDDGNEDRSDTAGQT